MTVDTEKLSKEEIIKLMVSLNERLKELEQYKGFYVGDNVAVIYTNGVIGFESLDYISQYFKECIDMGNVFHTKEEAEFELERRKVYQELKELADDDQEWNGDFLHYVLVWDYMAENLHVSYYLVTRNGEFYFKSMKSAQKAINKIGEDRLKKYYFRVK